MKKEEAITKANSLIARQRAGEEVSDEEISEALQHLRAARETAVGSKKKSTTPSAPVDLDALFS